MSEGRATAARRESWRPFVSRVIIQVSQIDLGRVKTGRRVGASMDDTRAVVGRV